MKYEKQFATKCIRSSYSLFNPAFCQYTVPVAQRQSNILKKVGLQLKPHWYCCKKLNNSCV